MNLCEGKIGVENRVSKDYTQGCNFVLLFKESPGSIRKNDLENIRS
ncbi:MAG: hypothetical protein BAJALOKI2v1_20073 [Promethearchaeota archaeon]|nr:MAG: hypothetical protein BAJALOKI2v1_20073 [Candidatus Lokiarchaeota archaeon]